MPQSKQLNDDISNTEIIIYIFKGPITIAIRFRFGFDSASIRLLFIFSPSREASWPIRRQLQLQDRTDRMIISQL